MDKTCLICFDEMDMKTYEAEEQSTETCFKLDCEHAFHTKCIIECLQKTNHKCPSCNQRKSVVEELTRDGLVKQLASEIKKSKIVINSIREFSNARHELGNTMKTLKEDVKKYTFTRKKELCIKEKRSYLYKCLESVKQVATEEAKRKGLIYIGIVDKCSKYNRRSLFQEGLIGRNIYQLYRDSHSRISIPI